MMHAGSLESSITKVAKELLEALTEKKSSFLRALQTSQMHENAIVHSWKHDLIYIIADSENVHQILRQN